MGGCCCTTSDETIDKNQGTDRLVTSDYGHVATIDRNDIESAIIDATTAIEPAAARTLPVEVHIRVQTQVDDRKQVWLVQDDLVAICELEWNATLLELFHFLCDQTVLGPVRELIHLIVHFAFEWPPGLFAASELEKRVSLTSPTTGHVTRLVDRRILHLWTIESARHLVDRKAVNDLLSLPVELNTVPLPQFIIRHERTKKPIRTSRHPPPPRRPPPRRSRDLYGSDLDSDPSD